MSFLIENFSKLFSTLFGSLPIAITTGLLLIRISKFYLEKDFMKKKIRLGVNIDHVATLRNARNENFPDLLKVANILKEL